MNFKSLKLAGPLKDKRVLIRLDLNLPMENGRVRDDFRIRKILPTLEYLRQNGAKTIAIAHIESVETDSLEPVFEALKSFMKLSFVKNLEDAREFLPKMKAGELVLVENLRHFDGEKANTSEFSEELADLGDIYVNEAFSVSHRKHASIIGVPKFLPSYAGLLFEEEVKNLSKAFNPPNPFLFILGGAKTKTKRPLIEKFLSRADQVFIGGVLANDFFKAKGLEVGQSIISETKFDLKKLVANKKVILPADVVIESDGGKRTVKFDAVGKNEKIFDAGIETIAGLNLLANQAKFILWNGPLGDYEKGFSDGTEGLARVLAQSEAETIVGGGDTLAVLDKLDLLDKFSFVSTAGGAMLDFLANETLPGIEALRIN